jgi:hypothetical protein
MVTTLSTVYERVAFAIRRLQNKKEGKEFQSRVDRLEQDDEVRGLRDENSILRARLAVSANEKAQVTRERDALFRKLQHQEAHRWSSRASGITLRLT